MNPNNTIPLITVIIPAYNAEGHLHRALDSVIKQSHKNLEIIVIDDGSTDATGRIADNYAQQDPRVRVLHVLNGGEAKSRNLGLSNASGEYIAFCDADDSMHPDMLKRMYSAIYRDKSDIAVCSWRNVDENGKELRWRTPNLKSCVLSSREAQEQFLLTNNIEGFCWNKLFKRELYIETGVQYDIRRLSFCDMKANLCLIQHAGKVSYIGEKLYDYYQLSTACTHTINVKKDIDYREVMEEIYNLCVDLDKESYIYRCYRINRHLYSMYKSKQSYSADFLKEYFITAYEKYIKRNTRNLFVWGILYPLDNPLKYMLKILTVYFAYKYYKRR